MEIEADVDSPLRRTMPKETIETLVSELIHEEDWRRMRATAACVAGGPRSVQALIEALRSGPTELKKEAAAMLARIKDPHAGVALVELLENDTEVVYKVSDFYDPQAERGVLWSDPELNISWPVEPHQATVSEKDAKLPLFKDMQRHF